MVISRVGPLSCGKVMGVLYGLIGLIIGAIFALISAAGAGAMMSHSEDAPAFMGAIFGVGAIIFLPIFYGVMGFVGGLIGAAIYNLVAGMVGGVEVDIR